MSLLSQLAEHAGELVRNASSMPVSAKPMRVYSYAVEPVPASFPAEALASAETVADTLWRVGGVDEKCICICPSGPAVEITLIPHNAVHAANWRTVIAPQLNGDNQVVAEFAAQLEDHVSQHTLSVGPGQALYTHGAMPWRLENAGGVKIFRAAEVFRMSEDLSAEQNASESAGAQSAQPIAPPEAAPLEKPKSLSSARTLYEALKARLDALDARAWNPKDIEQCSKAYAALSDEKTAKSKDVTRFCKLLETLGKRVAEAEEVQRTKLPELQQQISEMRSALNALALRTDLGAGLQKRREGNIAKCTEFEKTTSNLVAKTKEIGDRHAAVQKLVQDAGKKASVSASSSAAPMTTGRAKSSAAVAGASSSSTGAGPILLIPQVDLESLEPVIWRGKSEWHPAFKEIMSDNVLLNQMALTHSDNAALVALWNHFQEATKAIGAQITAVQKLPDRAAAMESLEIDMTAATAYHDALQEVRLLTTASANGGGASATGATKPRNAACEGCDERRPIFCENRCRACFVEELVDERIQAMNDRIKVLNKAAKAQLKARELKAIADGEDPDDLELGPSEVLKEAFDPLHDEIEEQFRLLSRKNSKIATWEKLKALLEQANGMLPPSAHSEEEEDGDDSSSREGLFDGAEDLPSNEASACSTPDRKQREAAATSSSSDSAGFAGARGASKRLLVADEALRVMHDIPVISVYDDIIRLYNAEDDRIDSLSFRLRDLRKDTKEVYGVRITDIRNGTTVDWPTYYLKHDEALQNSMRGNVDGVMKASVVVKKVCTAPAPADGGGGNGKKPKADDAAAHEAE